MKLATLCYIRNEGKTLMVYRNKKENDDHHGFWNGIGGKFEIGESPEDCAIREIKEETGLNALELQYKGLITFPNDFGKDDWYVFVFIVSEFSGELIENNEGDMEWIDDSKILSLNLHEGDHIFYKWLEKDKIFSAKFIYNGPNLSSYSVKFY